MATISVVLATFNEEENLPSCLDSVKDLADEIVIVDGSSKDKTVQIAKKYGARVLVVKNLPIFHINKQKAIDLATKDWILQLDADERVTQDLANEIKQILQDRHSGKRSASRISQDDRRFWTSPDSIGASQNDGETINGYWIPRKNWFLGRFLMKGGQYPDYTIRLYKKGAGRLPQKDVHEQAEIVGKIGYLNESLLHFPYKDFSSYVYKWSRYNNLLENQIREKLKGKSLTIKVYYGIGYLFVKPLHWFLTTYIRHKGFMDSWQGFVFSFFSALRFSVGYIKYIKNHG